MMVGRHILIHTHSKHGKLLFTFLELSIFRMVNEFILIQSMISRVEACHLTIMESCMRCMRMVHHKSKMTLSLHLVSSINEAMELGTSSLKLVGFLLALGPHTCINDGGPPYSP